MKLEDAPSSDGSSATIRKVRSIGVYTGVGDSSLLYDILKISVVGVVIVTVYTKALL
jgi:hypothetical protein